MTVTLTAPSSAAFRCEDTSCPLPSQQTPPGCFGTNQDAVCVPALLPWDLTPCTFQRRRGRRRGGRGRLCQLLQGAALPPLLGLGNNHLGFQSVLFQRFHPAQQGVGTRICQRVPGRGQVPPVCRAVPGGCSTAPRVPRQPCCHPQSVTRVSNGLELWSNTLTSCGTHNRTGTPAGDRAARIPGAGPVLGFPLLCAQSCPCTLLGTRSSPKARLDGTLSSLGCWRRPCPRGWNKRIFKAPSNPTLWKSGSSPQGLCLSPHQTAPASPRVLRDHSPSSCPSWARGHRQEHAAVGRGGAHLDWPPDPGILEAWLCTGLALAPGAGAHCRDWYSFLARSCSYCLILSSRAEDLRRSSRRRKRRRRRRER